LESRSSSSYTGKNEHFFYTALIPRFKKKCFPFPRKYVFYNFLPYYVNFSYFIRQKILKTEKKKRKI
jgi:hypothetical protein